MKSLEFDTTAFEDLAWWIEQDRDKALNVCKPRMSAEKVSLNPEQLENLKRFEDKLPQNAQPTTIYGLPNGGKAFQSEVLGKVPGSKAVYEKQVDAQGATMSYTKTTYAPNGSIIHVKQKYP